MQPFYFPSRSQHLISDLAEMLEPARSYVYKEAITALCTLGQFFCLAAVHLEWLILAENYWFWLYKHKSAPGISCWGAFRMTPICPPSTDYRHIQTPQAPVSRCPASEIQVSTVARLGRGFWLEAIHWFCFLLSFWFSLYCLHRLVPACWSIWQPSLIFQGAVKGIA